MKILLAACNAKYIHSNLAVYNLKSCSGEYSSSVVVKEYTINQIRDDILKDIYLEQPDVVCFSCYIWNISFVRELVPDLKKILPQVKCSEDSTGTIEASNQLSGAASAGWNPPDLNATLEPSMSWFFRMPLSMPSINYSATKITIRHSSSLTLPQSSELHR